MSVIAIIAAIFVAVLHFGFMYLETFLWTTPKGRKIFRQSVEDAETTKVLAANQGVYNGALAGAIVWMAIAGNLGAMQALLVFVVVVGAYGAATVGKNILFIQAIPAAIALGLSFI